MKFSRVLVANRGEIALRIMRTCQEMGIETVAVYSEADEMSLHVQAADYAVCVGPGPASESYLSVQNIIAAAKGTGCDAVHPGYGFLAENADFVDACEAEGLVFIGPQAAHIRAMGDKAQAKRSMIAAGVPVVPGSDGAVTDLLKAQQLAKEIGFPLMIKASAGGGGKGLRIAPAQKKTNRRFWRLSFPFWRTKNSTSFTGAFYCPF
jgi:acetyl-CoA carboxylase biotin carboxylase subunit